MDLAVEMPCSFNPVVSGARSIGMGGAFIGLSNDATASATNPGGLIQLLLPEISVVYQQLNRYEDYRFDFFPDSSNEASITEKNLNFLSFSYPFEWLRRNWVFSMAYQNLYNFDRQWFVNTHYEDYIIQDELQKYRQKGQLSALGFSFCSQITPDLSIGCTFNFWDHFIVHNGWEQHYDIIGVSIINNKHYAYSLQQTQDFSFQGFNMNFGLLWDISKHFQAKPGKIKMGMVLKTPFTADLIHRITSISVNPLYSDEPVNNQYTLYETLEMPLSCGLGLLYNVNLYWLISADIYYTNWHRFLIRNESGREMSPVTGMDYSTSDISDTIHMRFGTEYLLQTFNYYAIPFRFGLFYDPAPAEQKSDDFYGFSIGTGITRTGQYSMDIAYQYRQGRDVGKSFLKHLEFSEDIVEHSFMLSFIIYTGE
jgi:hypothetical protein